MDRELITSEIIYWLYQVLTGKDSEFLGWPAAAALTTKRKQLGLGSGTLQDWVQELLKKVVFKVRACFVHAWMLDKRNMSGHAQTHTYVPPSKVQSQLALCML